VDLLKLLEVSELSKNYGEKKALSDVSFSIEKGEIVGLIGRNGAGKTTILKSIGGLISYNRGSVLYRGDDIAKNPELIKEFGILIECAFLDYISAYDNLKILGWANNGSIDAALLQKMEEVLRLVDLYDVRKKKTKTYSFGMKQRLGLAQAILTAKGFLMLDEPFIGLDPVGKEVVKSVILQKARQENQGILFSSHDLPEVADICDRIIMLDKGTCYCVNSSVRKVTYAIVLQNDSIPDEVISRFPTGTEFDKQNQIVYFTDANEGISSINELIRVIVNNNLIIERISSGDEALKQLFNRKES
jgi:ABC-2 type transport system ATP-binding protein